MPNRADTDTYGTMTRSEVMRMRGYPDDIVNGNGQVTGVGLACYRDGLDGKRSATPGQVRGPLYHTTTATPAAVEHDYGPDL